ncbi:hypothetical protein T07_14311 [Trichinella nelsoni]|uniref:Uncharacterized protein n=1 Tax=Trichinella nelsoni TaxID=6336 RepID=A0A0V0RB94_9BILA|nr:hypothetical protein T07_14311 [Trichinella nelsoni]
MNCSSSKTKTKGYMAFIKSLHQVLFKDPEQSNLEEGIASTYQPSRYQTHKVCKGTWSIEP